MEENKTAAAPKKSYKKMPRRRVCVFCQEKVTEIDYKDITRLKKFVAESGKIMPRRIKKQRPYLTIGSFFVL